jgi:hypothetical protein
MDIQYFIAGSVQTEALMVGLVCGVFLILFIVAGIRQKLKDPD